MSAEEQRRALDYVRAVRERFIDEPKRYERFLSIMKDFKSSRCGAFKNRIACARISRARVWRRRRPRAGAFARRE